MLREVTTIKIIQDKESYILGPNDPISKQPTKTARNYTLTFNFVKEWEYSTSWENLSSTGKISFPKNMVVRYHLSDSPNTTQTKQLAGTNIKISDLFRRGDNIIITSHYEYWNRRLEKQTTDDKLICNGWISNVKSDNLIELEFEDHMWILKQIPMDNYVFKAGEDIRNHLQDVINAGLLARNNQYKFEISTTDNDILAFGTQEDSITFDGPIIATEHETIGQFLARIKKDLFIKVFFVEDTLGSIKLYVTYFPYNYKTTDKYDSSGNFQFQNNIISNDLIYKRKDDIRLSAVASNHILEENGTNKDGTKKMKKTRIEVLVELNKGGTGQNDDVIVTPIKKGETPATNQEGERRTFTFLNAKTEKDLEQLAKAQLLLYYNNGFSGKFTTFGTPHIKHGQIVTLSNKLSVDNQGNIGVDTTSQNIKISNGQQLSDVNTSMINPIITDRAGQYFVKGINYSGGINGYRQEITLDFKLLS